MDKLSHMRTFCAVVKEGGFSAAARQLDVSKVMVSRAIAQLEEDLGIRLLQRTTRKMSPTDDGMAYFERCLALLEEFDELDQSIKESGSEPRGRLRLSVPSEAFTSKHLIPFLVEFSKRHPKLVLDIMLSDRYVNIVDEGFDAAIRIGQLEDSSLIARKLADMKMLLCASKDYIESAKPIAEPEDLNAHEFVMDTNFRSGKSIKLRKQSLQVTVKPKANILINSAAATAIFLKQGLGIGICPSFMIESELASGELTQILPDWHISDGGIYLIYSHRKHLSAKISTLVSELIAHFAQTTSNA